MDIVRRGREIFDIEMQGLERARDALGPAFTDAVNLLAARLAIGGKLVVTGIGKNLPIAEKISGTLASTGATSVVLHPAQAMHGDLGILCPNDVLLALSYSGESEEILQIVPLVRREGIPIVAFTAAPDGSLARLSDIVLSVAVPREACPFNMAPTASTTATLALGDALAVCLLEARGFRREDYAKLHPGGAIGRALLLRVRDIMRTGDRLARVSANAPVRDALLAMTRAHSGAVGVVDADDRLQGIFTDGDLRRRLADGADALLVRPVAEVMTTSPITVRADDLAVDVLRAFETHRIDDVLVTDDDGRLVGAVDSQDLPKLKIL